MRHLAEIGSCNYRLILKYRQGGVTTLYEIDELDEALWVPGMTCAIIAHEAKRLPEYFNIVKTAFRYLPEKLKPRTKTDTKYMYEFTERFDGAPLNSSIYVATDIRGGTVQRLHITESAYIKDRTALKSGSKQAVPIGGIISEETTGNGFNEFYDDYEAARNNKNPGLFDYRAFFYPWIMQTEYQIPGDIDVYTDDELKIKEIVKKEYGAEVTDGQLLWRRWKIGELRSGNNKAVGGQSVGLNAVQLFKQEYPLTVLEAFQSGAGSVFNSEMVDSIAEPEPLSLSEMVNTIGDDVIGAEEKKASLRLFSGLGVRFWKLPESGREYVIGCDPSDGQGSDNGVIDVWDPVTLEQCAQFYGKMRPDELAELIAELGKFYNEAFAGVENNMLSTILFLSKIYSRYYFETRIDEKTMKKTKKIGWSTNTKTRDPMIDEFVALFEEDGLVIRSAITKGEMKTFVKKDNGKREHSNGKHDDALFAAFIAVQMRKHYKPTARAFATKPF